MHDRPIVVDEDGSLEVETAIALFLFVRQEAYIDEENYLLTLVVMFI